MAGRNRRRYGLLTRGVLGVGDDAFSPLDIAGLQLWYDAADVSTLFQDSSLTTPAVADGDVVGGWLDKSGNSRTGTQATTSKKPVLKTNIINGRSIIRFDGTDDNYQINNYTLSASDHHIFVVFNPAGVTGINRWFFDTVTGRLILAHLSGSVSGFLGFFSSGTWKAPASATSGNQLLEFSLVSGTTQARILRNGVQIGANAQYDATAIGGASSFGSQASPNLFYLNADVGEYLDYNIALSNEQAFQVRTYLNNKWAVY